MEHVCRSNGVQWSGIEELRLRGLRFAGARWVEGVDALGVPCHGRKANWICCGLRKDGRRDTLRMSVSGPMWLDGLRIIETRYLALGAAWELHCGALSPDE